MTPADERIVQLLEKWRTSLALHTRYTRLSDDQYWLVQPWPQHQRPTPWIVDLASQRLADLQRIVQTRVAAGDPSLSEALELMSFLANLVGSQHVQRYIPMAELEQQRPIESLTVQDTAQTRPAVSEPPPAPAPAPAAQPEELEPVSPADAPEAAAVEVDEFDTEVVRDAVRLLSWGREWHELPAAIARMAGRPKTTRIREILKTHRESIERQATDRPSKH
jgi:hypothetical protein